VEKVDTNSDGIDGDLTVERAQLGTTVAVHYHGALVHKVLPITGAQRCTAWEWDGTGCAQWSTIGMCPGGAWVRESGVVTASLDDSVDAGVALRFSFDLQNPSDAQESPEVSVRISGMQFDNDDGAASRLTSHVLAKDGVSIPGFAGARASDAFPLKTYAFGLQASSQHAARLQMPFHPNHRTHPPPPLLWTTDEEDWAEHNIPPRTEHHHGHAVSKCGDWRLSACGDHAFGTASLKQD